MLEQQKIDTYVMTNQKYFPQEKIMYLKDKLRTMDDQKFSLLSTVEKKDPTIMFVISLFLGVFGIDSFMLGDTGRGVLKLLTLGGLGILWFIDFITITKKVKEHNFNNLMTLI